MKCITTSKHMTHFMAPSATAVSHSAKHMCLGAGVCVLLHRQTWCVCGSQSMVPCMSLVTCDRLLHRRALVKYRQEASAAQQQIDKVGGGNGKAPPPPPSSHLSRHPSQSHGHSHWPHHQHSSNSHSESQTQSGPQSQHQYADCNGKGHSTDLQHPAEGMGDEMADTLSRIHTPNAADDRKLTGSPEHSPHQSPVASSPGSTEASQAASPQNEDSHRIDMPANGQLPPSCSASSVHGASPSSSARKSQCQPASAKKADVQDLKEMEEGSRGGTDDQTKHMNGKHDMGTPSRRTLNQDEFFERDFMLAPSSYACEYEPDIAPDKLADIYTGSCCPGCSTQSQL